jgi:hypothetical protein
MSTDRRNFLIGLLAAGCVPGALTMARADTATTDFLHLTARQVGERFEAVVLDAQGNDHYIVPLKARGHGFALNPVTRQAVAFARQPGYFAVHFDVDGKTEPRVFVMPKDRHFFGHGVFTPNGQLILTTENDYGEGRSVMGVYDAQTLERKGEWLTNGLGAHDVVLMPDGKTLCVANGGILTHPDYGRAKLNLDSMIPSLAYLDLATGDLLDEVKLAPDLHQLSIRHMAVDARGAVWFGCQYEGPATDDPPLVGRHVRGRAIEMFGGPADVRQGCKHYIGSVAADTSGTIIATTSPVGGCVLFWNAATGAFLGTNPIADICGISSRPLRGAFLGSTGEGILDNLDMNGRAAAATQLKKDKHINWDNHIMAAKF